MNIKKLFNNEAGVSPIVATLVLVVVAIAGAAAVGTILGSFSSDVSSSASAEGAAAGASTQLLIAGSSTVQPVSELLAKDFMKQNSGIKVTVQAGGSGAGITSAKLGIVDIGASSEDVDTITAYPELQKHQIGASAVVLIGNGIGNATGTVPSKAQIKTLFESADANGKVSDANLTTAGFNTTGSGATLFQRSETSGTEETFSYFIHGSSKTWMDGTKAVGKSGNAGVLAAVESTTNSIGFVDFGFAESSTGVVILPVDTMTTTVKKDVKSGIKATLKGETSTFPSGLTRPLLYLTNGAPSTIEKSFIDFATQPAQKGYFTQVGYFSMYDIL
ncbi:PstS family phosphate ABC transporter substrate-binding protein [Methanolobus sp.]|uniref:PstS family phosphate ABC transporter substrate-binding protein n=1 Tax=Methanolobus sp. TaxID=1874737 RepID=UPI0025CFC442|nr:PstS family phosphate ABC transporter substrate-binding protein [Methanolobus sp.]